MGPGAPLEIRLSEPDDSERLAAFASARPLAWNDFASIASMQLREPRVWLALARDAVVAAAIDDGLAMSVAGDHQALRSLAAMVPDRAGKLVIAGRTDEVRAFVQGVQPERTERPEHLMKLAPGAMRVPAEAVPLRVATSADLEILVAARVAALEEEYGMVVPTDSTLYAELESAVERAVGLQGVAMWVDDGRCAFTAQLIAKTPEAAMFGDLYVAPELRGRGVATRALAAFCAWLTTESRYVTLRVGVQNDPAVRLYDRVGFIVEDHFLSSLRPDPL